MTDLRKRIAKRVAQELNDGDVVNLGIGLPTMVANYIPGNVDIVLQSENGIMGMGEASAKEEENADIINAGAQYVTVKNHAAFLDSASSFGIIRGHHVDVTVLGALEVDRHGNLSNWIIPGKLVPGMGGAMDLVVGAKKVIVAMLHTQKGKHKILEKCTLPYTAVHVIDKIITEMGVMEIQNEQILLTEIYSDYSIADVKKATGCDIIVSENLKTLYT